MFRLVRVRHSTYEGRYRLLDLIGEGPVGQLWTGLDTVTQGQVTVRTFSESIAADRRLVDRLRHTTTEQLRPRLIQGKPCVRLAHPSVARILGFHTVETPPSSIAVMEPLPGTPLPDHRRDHLPLPMREIVSIGSQLADGLRAAHEAQVVHGCPHPGSVIVSPWGRAILLDFGVMDALVSVGRGSHDVAAFLPFLAPEVVARRARPTPSSDVYSLGVLLVEMGSREDPGGELALPAWATPALARTWRDALDPDPGRRPTAAALCAALRVVVQDAEEAAGRNRTATPEGAGEPTPGGSAGEPLVALWPARDPVISLAAGAETPPADPFSAGWRVEASLRQRVRAEGTTAAPAKPSAEADARKTPRAPPRRPEKPPHRAKTSPRRTPKPTPPPAPATGDAGQTSSPAEASAPPGPTPAERWIRGMAAIATSVQRGSGRAVARLGSILILMMHLTGSFLASSAGATRRGLRSIGSSMGRVGQGTLRAVRRGGSALAGTTATVGHRSGDAGRRVARWAARWAARGGVRGIGGLRTGVSAVASAVGSAAEAAVGGLRRALWVKHRRIWVLGAVLALALVTMVLVLPQRIPSRPTIGPTAAGSPQAPQAPQAPPAPPAPGSSIVPTPGSTLPPVTELIVPNLVGLTAFDANQQLIGVGLTFDRVEPVEGPPGEVVRTVPPAGQVVPVGTPVVLFVGAPQDRVPGNG
jgi:serine/threonine protein kinase